ncbi:MAG: hypothetical protein HY059_09335 [Proteobacteria bacterium]|nr:hypothetical protein [Pseudomonadota bacterium]
MLIAAIAWAVLCASTLRAEGEGKRDCFGMLWCRSQEDGGVSTDAFLYLYSTRDKGSFSRLALRPFYFRESDAEKTYERRSVLWPLGDYERRGGDVSFHVFPLYWHARSPALSYSVLPPLYFDYAAGERSYRHLFPFYGRHLRGDHYARTFVLGPVFISTRDRRAGSERWDFLFPLFGHLAGPGAGATWLFPAYFSDYDDREKSSSMFVLPGYWSSVSPKYSQRGLIPLFGKEDQEDVGEHRLSMLGLPPSRALGPHALALYEHRSAPGGVSDRFFPLYHFASGAGESSLGVLGVGGGWSFFRRIADKDSAAGHLFPLYSYDRDSKSGERSLGLIGWGPVSMYRRHSTRQGLWDSLFPIYQYESGERGAALSVLGIDEAAFYRQASYGPRFSSRLFPFYRYSRDGNSGETDWDALFLYRHRRTPSSAKDAFLPLFHYERDDAKRRKTFAMLGFPPIGDIPALSFYLNERSGDRTIDRFFPIYRYSADAASKTTNLNVLLVYDRYSSEVVAGDFLFPLYSRRRAGEEREFGALGFGPVSLAYSLDSPSVRLRQILPFYFHREERASGREFSSAFLLYLRQKSPESKIGGVLPFYSYREQRDLQATYALGVLEFSAYQHLRSSSATLRALVPFYGRRENSVSGESRTTALGLPPWVGMPAFSLYMHDASTATTRDRLLPLYDYGRDAAAGETRLAVLGFGRYGGLPALSLYEHVRSSTGVSDRLFPLYAYGYDARAGQSKFGALLYYSSESPARKFTLLFPFYSYERDKADESVRVGVLGWAPLSLYQHLRTKDRVDDRIWGLYHYHADRPTQEGGVSFLWPFVDYKSDKNGSEFSVLWWLVDYTRSADQTRELRLLGGSAMALFRRKATPRASKVEFNPIIPLYSHETEEGKLKEWSFLGFGRCTKDGRPRPKVLWYCS